MTTMLQAAKIMLRGSAANLSRLQTVAYKLRMKKVHKPIIGSELNCDRCDGAGFVLCGRCDATGLDPIKFDRYLRRLKNRRKK